MASFLRSSISKWYNLRTKSDRARGGGVLNFKESLRKRCFQPPPPPPPPPPHFQSSSAGPVRSRRFRFWVDERLKPEHKCCGWIKIEREGSSWPLLFHLFSSPWVTYRLLTDSAPRKAKRECMVMIVGHVAQTYQFSLDLLWIPPAVWVGKARRCRSNRVRSSWKSPRQDRGTALEHHPSCKI